MQHKEGGELSPSTKQEWGAVLPGLVLAYNVESLIPLSYSAK